MMIAEWTGIFVSLLHSAMFSGLNLGFFGISRLKLVVRAENGDKSAGQILQLRTDAHLLLATLLWGNVASNVMLALIADSILTGVWAFLFSTVGITLFGEIFPQAYLAKHALKISYILVPIVKFYQVILYPVAKPTALFLDRWLGKEEISYFQEEEIKILLERHSRSKLTDLAHLEMVGAVNFLTIDDIKVADEGEVISPQSIIALAVNKKGWPAFPKFQRDFDDPFLQKLQASREKWVIITDKNNQPLLVLNANRFLRDAIYGDEVKSIYTYCHRPIVVTSDDTKLGEVILKFKVRPEHSEDDVVDNDLILFWGKQKRIITGADILGRLLRGIVKTV